MKFAQRSPGNGRPLRFFGAVAAAVLITGCSTGSRSLSQDTLQPIETDPTTTTVVVSTTAPPPTTTARAVTTLPIPTTTLPMIPSTIIATTSLVPPTAPPSTTPPTATQTTPPPGTAPPSTAPASTAPPSSATGSGGCEACKPDYVFAWSSHFTVPQLGTEPVRGTGCGADGSLGETIPDGVWNGHIEIGAQSLKIDVQCMYYGDSARPFIAACEQKYGTDGDECSPLGEDSWIVNSNPRKRTVPLDPGFRRRFENLECADPGPGKGATSDNGAESFDSWLIIEDGRATFALTSCVYG